ncbi:MAG: glycogen/starch/alpha-glucan phosphorylase [Opitutales bacterium]|nr:glycogen/starch/alpha-glucan phosphorylase [Opitutales bacterium]
MKSSSHTLKQPLVSCDSFSQLPTESEFCQCILQHLHKTLARHTFAATPGDWLNALAYAVRDTLLDSFMTTMGAHHYYNVRRVYYLSMEYLVGRLTGDTLVNLGIYDIASAALKQLGLDLADLLEEEPDMGLGNGGLGRLAACFMDSLATLEIPAVGYGVNYEFGLFRQSFRDGRQMEAPDEWRAYGSPWQIIRPEYRVEVPVGGHLEVSGDGVVWIPESSLIGVPSDIPVVGYGVNTVNFLRLWEARASCEFDFHRFDAGNYSDAVREKVESETVSKVLYPNDNSESGKKLRLLQEYFFVACSISDIIRRHLKDNPDISNLADKANLHINDTHPAIAVAELMRRLLDEHAMPWEEAWEATVKICAYTNHTLMPEALEKWSVAFFEEMLPRHLHIIREIDARFTESIFRHWPDDPSKMARLSIIEASSPPMVRMAHLAIAGSHSINGVAELHTKLLREQMFPDMETLFPGRFNNKTNGVTPRRWMRTANPALAALIDESIGNTWTSRLEDLALLEPYAADAGFCEHFAAIKHRNKEHLARVIADLCGIAVDPSALFDVQIKRLHEYKRQHLNLLHIIHLYQTLLNNPQATIQPRVFVFGAKAAPGYRTAKQIIHAINAVARLINSDNRIRGQLCIAFLPNYGVSLAQQIIPAADLSEQISTAGYEASGTGNMKLALNGALTIGTLDGANIEICEQVGQENCFIFGLTAEQVKQRQQQGYAPSVCIEQSPALERALRFLESGILTPSEPDAFRELCGNLRHSDPFLVCADFDAYCQAQTCAADAFSDTPSWVRKAVLNVARCGIFSSDRTIAQYAADIWKTPSVSINVPD